MIAWDIGNIMINHSTISILNIISFITISLCRIFEMIWLGYVTLAIIAVSTALYLSLVLQKSKGYVGNRFSVIVQPIMIVAILIYSLFVLNIV